MISRLERPYTRSSAISSRFANERYQQDGGSVEYLNIAGAMPPACRSNLVLTGYEIPAVNEASSLVIVWAIPNQNRWSSIRPSTSGRPSDGSGARPDDVIAAFERPSASSFVQVSRRPFESAHDASQGYHRDLSAANITGSMSRKADCFASIR